MDRTTFTKNDKMKVRKRKPMSAKDKRQQLTLPWGRDPEEITVDSFNRNRGITGGFSGKNYIK